MKKPLIKIIIGILLIVGGLFGVSLVREGVKELGTLGQMRLGEQNGNN